MMKIPEEGILLRIFIGESDRFEGKPLYEHIVMLARKNNLAGATVLRGIMGFGAASRVHSTKILRLSEDLPIIIEIVDSEGKIQNFLSLLDNLVTEGLITIEKAHVIKYRHQ